MFFVTCRTTLNNVSGCRERTYLVGLTSHRPTPAPVHQLRSPTEGLWNPDCIVLRAALKKTKVPYNYHICADVLNFGYDGTAIPAACDHPVLSLACAASCQRSAESCRGDDPEVAALLEEAYAFLDGFVPLRLHTLDPKDRCGVLAEAGLCSDVLIRAACKATCGVKWLPAMTRMSRTSAELHWYNDTRIAFRLFLTY